MRILGAKLDNRNTGFRLRQRVCRQLFSLMSWMKNWKLPTGSVLTAAWSHTLVQVCWYVALNATNSPNGLSSWGNSFPARRQVIVLWNRTDTILKPCFACWPTWIRTFAQLVVLENTRNTIVTTRLFCVTTYSPTFVEFIVVRRRTDGTVPKRFVGKATWLHAFVLVCCYGAHKKNNSHNGLVSGVISLLKLVQLSSLRAKSQQ